VERIHGGRSPPGTIDLSVPTNPRGPPGWVLDAAARGLRRLTSYPDYQYHEAREALSRLSGARPELIVPLNGAAEALYLLALALRPERIVSVEPTFGDHRLLAQAIGARWRPIVWPPGGDPPVEEYCREASKGRALGLVSNPDNPHGGMVPPGLVEEMARCTSGVLLVDEAFIRLSDHPEWSLQARPPPGAVVAGSLTKELSVPGARAGYLVAPDPRLADMLDAVRQPWNLNSIAAEIIVEAGRDPERYEGFLAGSREMIRILRSEYEGLLSRAGLQVYPSHAPYILARGPENLHECLVRAGFYVRDASGYPGLSRGYVRFSLVPGVAERLAVAVGGCVGA